MIGFFKKFFFNSVHFVIFYKIFRGNEKPIINGSSKFFGNIKFGRNNHFNGAELQGQGGIEIGDNFHSAKGLVILTQNHNWKGEALPYDHTVIKKKVIIGDNVWVGLNVIILPGVTIGEGCIIQAGSVVSKNIPDYAIAGGNPAQVIKLRDLDHYNRLKNDKKFH
ncbi:MAG: acyltransferase [Acinetobacter sp.]|nr:MAG: acyltransferase [Acinetobacter sp.]